MKEHHPAVN